VGDVHVVGGRARGGHPHIVAARLALVLEVFFTGLLVAVSILIAWFSFYVVYKLYKGQE
jgi:hypothetical protein